MSDPATNRAAVAAAQPCAQPDAADLTRRLQLTQRLRRGLTALGLVGALLITLPLAQLLRYQAAELKTLAGKREGLNPVARAVDLQRGLLAHRELAHQVLQGQDKLESDRLQRQQDVDSRVAILVSELSTGHWDLAMGEADDMRMDWLQLARQVQSREVDASGSDQAHGLLVEQTLQVVDLVSTAHTAAVADSQPTPGLGSGVPAPTMALVRSMPRLLWMTAQLDTAPAGAASDATLRRLPLLENAMARLLGPVEGARLRAPAVAALPAAASATSYSRVSLADADPELLGAAAAAGAASERYFSLLRTQPAGNDALAAASRSALQAQLRLFDVAHAQATRALALQARGAAQRRALLLGATCFGLLMAFSLFMSLRRDLRALEELDQRLADEQAQAPVATDGQSGGRQQAEWLLQRLRENTGTSEPSPVVPAAHRPASDPTPATPSARIADDRRTPQDN